MHMIIFYKYGFGYSKVVEGFSLRSHPSLYKIVQYIVKYHFKIVYGFVQFNLILYTQNMNASKEVDDATRRQYPVLPYPNRRFTLELNKTTTVTRGGSVAACGGSLPRDALGNDAGGQENERGSLQERWDRSEAADRWWRRLLDHERTAS